MTSFVTQSDIQMSGPGLIGSDVLGASPRRSKLIVIGAGLSLVDGELVNTLDLSAYLTTETAAETYLPLAGGTLTGDLKFTDATYDIGKSGATRPRDGFFSGNLTVGSQLVSTQTWTSGGINKLWNGVITPTSASASSTWIDISSSTTWGGNAYPAITYTPYNGNLSFNGIWGEGSIQVGKSATGVLIQPVYGTGLRFAVQGAYSFRVGMHGEWGGNTQFENWHVNNALVFTGTGFSGAIAWDASNILHQRNSTNAQTFRLAETWTSSTSFGALQIKANAGAAYQIGSAIGSAGGTNRAVEIGHWNAAGAFTSALSVATNGLVGVQHTTSGPGSGISIRNSSISGYAELALLDSSGVSVAGLGYGNASASYSPSGAYFYTNTKNFAFSLDTGNTNTLVLEASTRRVALNKANAPGAQLHVVVNGASTVGQIVQAASSQSANITEWQNSSGAVLTFVGNKGAVSIAPEISTSGSPTAFTITGAAHTTLATAEVTDGYFNATRTVNFGATGGTVASQRTWRFTAPTFTAAAATTFTTASTLSISGPPVASTNVTVTNAYALNVESGKACIAGDTVIGTLTILSGGGSAGACGISAGTFTSSEPFLTGYPWHFAWIDNVPKITMQTTNGPPNGIRIASDCALSFVSTANSRTGTPDVNLWRDATGVLAQRNSTTAQIIRVYNTYASSTSGEWGEFNWQTTTNVLRIGSNKGSAGGSARDVAITHGGTVVANFLADRFYLGPIADSTATGGNARGANSVDLQVPRGAASQVASGLYSVILGGQANTASGNRAICVAPYVSTASGDYAVVVGGSDNVASGRSSFIGCGESNQATASYATIAGGFYTKADRYGQTSHAAGSFVVCGDAQRVGFVLRRKTTDATPTNLGLDGSTTRLTIPSGKTMSGFLIVKGIKSDGSAKARFVRLCDITNVGGTTSLDTPIEAIGTDYNPSGCVLAVTAEDATDDLQVNITGPAGETWRWTATFNGLEIAYGV